MARKVCKKGHTYDANLEKCPVCGEKEMIEESITSGMEPEGIKTEDNEKTRPPEDVDREFRKKPEWQIAQLLYENADSLEKANKRINLLIDLVIALAMEVEVLRSLKIEEALKNGQRGELSDYGKMYKEIALLTHNCAGTTDGVIKLLHRWINFGGFDESLTGGYREEIVLERLKFTAEEIRTYKAEAKRMHGLT